MSSKNCFLSEGKKIKSEIKFFSCKHFMQFIVIVDGVTQNLLFHYNFQLCSFNVFYAFTLGAKNCVQRTKTHFKSLKLFSQVILITKPLGKIRKILLLLLVPCKLHPFPILNKKERIPWRIRTAKRLLQYICFLRNTLKTVKKSPYNVYFQMFFFINFFILLSDDLCYRKALNNIISLDHELHVPQKYKEKKEIKMFI